MPTATRGPSLDQAALDQIRKDMRVMRGLMMQVVELLRIVAAPRLGPADASEFETVDVLPLEDVAISVSEAAASLGIGAEQTRRLLRSGLLGGVQLGGRRGWLVSKASVQRLRLERSLAGAPSLPAAKTDLLSEKEAADGVLM